MKPLFVLFIASLAAGHRDIAPNPVNREGTALQPATETAIAMTSEKVVLTLSEDSAHVRASFVLRNTSKAEERLEVGFPGMAQPSALSVDDDGIPIVEAWGPPRIEDFVAEVDGEPVQARPKVSPRVPAWPSRKGWRYEHSYWLCWAMAFAPEQTQVVEVSYRVRTEDINYTEPSPLQNRQVAYVLKTGAGWKGPIGKAEISLRTNGEIALDHVTRTDPPPSKVSEDEYLWSFEDFEPSFDIVVHYRAYRDAADAVVKAQHRLQKSPEDLWLLLDLAENLAALERWEEAATTYARLAELADAQRLTHLRRAQTPYEPIWYRAARCWDEIDRRSESRACATKALVLLEELFAPYDRAPASRQPWPSIERSYGTSRLSLEMIRDECRILAKE